VFAIPVQLELQVLRLLVHLLHRVQLVQRTRRVELLQRSHPLVALVALVVQAGCHVWVVGDSQTLHLAIALQKLA
jgi:ADP-heptose:LPS heptosyltransferase